jgi:hypothetical protein
MSFDLDLYLRKPAGKFSDAVRAELAGTEFDGEVVVTDDWDSGDPWVIFEDEVMVEAVTPASIASDASRPEVAALLHGATHRVSFSMRMSSAPVAIELAARLARHANGTIWDPQVAPEWLAPDALAQVPLGHSLPSHGIYDANYAQAIAEVMKAMEG